MIAFGCSVAESDAYVRYTKPGIDLAAEPDSAVFSFAALTPIGRAYNLLLDAAAKRDDLEALVIVHPHTQIDDPDLCPKVRAALSAPEVAVVGCIGASNVETIAWWQGSVSSGPVTHRYTSNGGGEFPAFGWARTSPAPAEVDVIDGFLMVLSPWAVRHVRFDEELALGHGYDFDYCTQVRAAGRRVITADLRVIQHRSLEIVGNPEVWVESHIAVSRKWHGRMPGRAIESASWKDSARRAEAEREAERTMAYFKQLGLQARVDVLEQELEQAESTLSWRLTEPLRRANKWRRERAAGAEISGN